MFNLKKEQKKAVECINQPTLISAGPGSGKTRTITAKIMHLISLGYAPERILAITFTNKAADEMKHRVEETTKISIDKFPWIKTFHSACLDIIKKNCQLLNFTTPIHIYGDAKKKAICKIILDKYSIEKKYLESMANMISLAKNYGDPIKYIQNNNNQLAYQCYNDYMKKLILHNAVDFEDLLLYVQELLQNNLNIRLYYQKYFQYILIDEFQDSNNVQNNIVSLLVNNGNLTIVGDDYQSIYSFRGANPSNFISFSQQYNNAVIITLEENFRCNSNIASAADALIKYNQNQLLKNCFSKKQGELLEIKAFNNQDDEAIWITEKCREYHNKYNIPYKNIGILYRTKSCANPFEEAMVKAGVPYKVFGSKSVFERREVRDVISYLFSAINIKDDEAFERIINVPKRGIGDKAIENIKSDFQDNSLQEACHKAIIKGSLSNKLSTKLKKLLRFLSDIRTEKPDNAVNQIIKRTDYLNYMKSYSGSDIEYKGRLDMLQLITQIASSKQTIDDFLVDVSLLNEEIPDMSKDNGGVRLSTIHASKGLEYKIVFLVALENGIIPHSKSSNIEEERRLMFVGMTRAENKLHLSYAKFRNISKATKSIFIDEIPAKYIKK